MALPSPGLRGWRTAQSARSAEPRWCSSARLCAITARITCRSPSFRSRPAKRSRWCSAIAPLTMVSRPGLMQSRCCAIPKQPGGPGPTAAAPAGRYSEAVKQSLLVLKGLTYEPTGGIVAAATTSLPEQAGGVRNWDYRYCWLRDATFTLLALGEAGYPDEARAWRDWLLRAVAGGPEQIQIMYGIGGERRLPEWTADWLPGFEHAK